MQKGSVKISLIINTFNVSNYVDRAISSVLPQLTEETELIIIDDGSTDGTVEKIKKSILNKHNVHVIAKIKNEGISAARNQGILKSIGEYILFIDGDDYIDNNAVAKLINIINKNDVDIIGYNMEAIPDYVNNNKLSNREKKYVSYDIKPGIYTKSQLLESLFRGKLKHNPVSYIFKKKVFLENEIFFPEDINYGEDYATIYKFLNSVEKGIIINERLYKYVQRSGSATHKPRIKYAQDNFRVSHEILDYFRNTNYYYGAEIYVIPRLMTALSIAVRADSDTQSKEIIREIENEIKLLSTSPHNLKRNLNITLKFKVYLNNVRLLKYIYYYKRT